MANLRPSALGRSRAEAPLVCRERLALGVHTKIRSVRSILVISATFFVGGLAAASGPRRHSQAPGQASFEPTAISRGAPPIAQLIMVVIGALVITSEYGTRMISTY